METEIRRGILVVLLVASAWFPAAAGGLGSFRQRPPGPSAQRPDLTGTWELDMKASRLADGGPIDVRGYRAMTVTFIHTEPQIAVHYDVKGVEASGDRRQAYIVTTDGKEKQVVLNGQPAVAWAKWEGDSLAVYHRRAIGADGFTETRRLFTLDGASMRSVPTFRNKVDGKETPEFGGDTEVWRKR